MSISTDKFVENHILCVYPYHFKRLDYFHCSVKEYFGKMQNVSVKLKSPKSRGTSKRYYNIIICK